MVTSKSMDLGGALRTGKNALINGWGLIAAGAWPTLLYRLNMKWRGIDLGFVSVKDLGSTDDRSTFHGSSGGPDLEIILNSLKISPSDEVLDLGCGKAGAMLTMAKYPFARVDGVEISNTLIEVARENLRRMKVSKSTLYHSDAAEFTDLDRYTFFYMYYPFPRVVTNRVLENLTRSLERRRRRITLISNNSVDHDLVLTFGFRVESEFLHFHTPHPGYVYSAGSTA